MPKRDADDRPRIAGDAPSSRGEAAATVRVDRARAPGLRPVPAQHAQMFSVAEDMVRRASRSAAASSAAIETGRHVPSRPMKTPHSKGSRDQFAEVKELSFSQPRRVGISSTREEETFRAAQVSARCGGDGASRVRGRAGGVDLRRCLQQRVGVLLCVPARCAPSRFVSLIHLSSEKRTPRSRLTPPLFSPSAPAFQLTRYYRYGELDTCEGRWAAIWACMDRSKRYVPGSIEGGEISPLLRAFSSALARR